MWKLLIAIIVLGVGAAALWVNAGRAPGPVIEIGGPEVVGQTGEISVTVTAPNGALKDLQVTLTQGASSTSVFALTPETASELKADGDRVTVKQLRASKIPLDDRFLARVVPPILANSTELHVDDPSNMLASYLAINRELRRLNNETITKLSHETAPEMLWRGHFKQLLNTAVEAGFADQRTYLYN